MVLGDLNIPEINWNLWITNKNEKHFSYKFLETLRDNFLEQPVITPTRWVHDMPGNILDLCLVDNRDIINSLDITSRIGNSDHLCIGIELTCPVVEINVDTVRRNFYRGDYKSANVKLSEINWEVMEQIDVEESLKFYSETVKIVVNDTIPVYKNPKKKTKPPWMDNYCLKLVEQKAWKRYTFSRNRIDYTNYCQIRNKVTRSVRFAKKIFERGISLKVKDNQKSFWKFVKTKTKAKSSIGDLKDNSGEWISDDYEQTYSMHSLVQYLPKMKMTICLNSNMGLAA